VSARVARHVEHVEFERGRCDRHVIAIFETMREMRDRFTRGAVDGHGLAIQQIGHPADVVLMVVRE
jgi:peptide deformylase